MPIGQVIGVHEIPSSFSRLSRISSGSIESRSSLLMKVMTGVRFSRQTSSSLRVWVSTPLAASITISTESTAVSVRNVSSLKSLWPGVSSRFSARSR